MAITDEIRDEVDRAKTLYPSFNSCHEGYAVILEEVHELWDLVRACKGVTANMEMRKECIQIAAMAIRYVEDLYHDALQNHRIR